MREADRGARAGTKPVALVWGEDDHAVQRRARQILEGWARENPGAEEEVIDASAGTSDEVFRALARLREALQTLPFLASSRSIWFRGCSFLGEDRVSEAAGVLDALAALGGELSAFRWEGIRLVVSAAKVDRRRSFYKTLEKISDVDHFPGLSPEDPDWRDKAEALAAGEFRALGKRLSGEALAALVENIGAHASHFAGEIQKLTAYVGDRDEVTLADVDAVVTRGRHARAFALADAFGERNLAKALRHLEQEFWAMRSDRQKSEIGLLYGLVAKVRAMLMSQGLLDARLIRASTDYRSFAAQLKNLPERLPGTDSRYNPREIKPYVLFRAAQHAANFTREELIAAMEALLQCNGQLVTRSADARLVLQCALARLIGGGSKGPRRTRAPLEGTPDRA